MDIANGTNTTTNDQTTLVIIKSHLFEQQPSHPLRRNWSSATSVCTWAGVACTSRRHHHPRRVTRLNLASLGLVGTIPPQLGHLSFLTYLNISDNGFNGSLPDEVAGLRRLRVLDAAHNSFSGHIPAGLAKLIKLKCLNLSNNHFQGAIPREIGDLGELEMLVLSSNKIAGTIPTHIANLTNLRMLGLHDNQLTGSIPSGIFNISTLQYLYLANNELSGTLPATMGQDLPILRHLFLNKNNLRGQIPESIANASMLSILSLETNHFSGPIPTSLGNLKNLICLHLFQNMFTSDSSQELPFLTSLTNSKYLKDIILDDNPLHAFLPTSIGNFSFNFKKLTINGCRIKGELPKEIGNLSNLIQLELKDNDLHGSVPETFRGMSSLQGLFLGGNNIEGPFPQSVCDLHALSELNLSHNEFSGAIPGCIGNVTSLQRIDLGSNMFGFSLPIDMWNLVDLVGLDLSRNAFDGHLSQEIGSLKTINYMDVSENRLTGEIPSGFRSMTSLSYLSLAKNELEGAIPASLGEIANIAQLDLSYNNLSGEIPTTLEKLRFLRYINVSHNKLRGSIPIGGWFESVDDYRLFASNEALCGPPRLRISRCPRKRRNKVSVIVIISIVVASFIVVASSCWAMRYKRRHSSTSLQESIDPSSNAVFARFSYQEILDATRGFSSDNLLGSGSFGSVYKAAFENGLISAVKVFDPRNRDGFKSFERECKALANLRHRNLTQVVSSCSNLDFKALILEYMPNGSLDDWLHTEGKFLGIMQRLDIMIDVASALEYLHHEYHTPVIHCDLKPSNILLDKDMVGHVTDFGIMKLLGKDETCAHTETLATLGYIAPEFGLNGIVSSASDVYSYGILLMETFTRKRPSDEMFSSDMSIRKWIDSLRPNGLREATELKAEDKHFIRHLQCVSMIIDLALACTVEYPKDRVNIKDVRSTLQSIKHRFSEKL
ncbi:receptor kinase-like protein Xa21 [Andrographis paniculata]|uniref:receptor kinase-like protein Xa21 n=1 Tax=Andrographis paniculata TaxID=175694 RepID=UPI0021E6FB30|nr:receptor kinase-like protein Xa21 [Andrographis paniculata]